MSLPRYVVSDGTRLFVADGGNDRVMVYNSIPTVTGQLADEILGQPDQYSDNTGQNPDGTDAFQSPPALPGTWRIRTSTSATPTTGAFWFSRPNR